MTPVLDGTKHRRALNDTIPYRLVDIVIRRSRARRGAINRRFVDVDYNSSQKTWDPDHPLTDLPENIVACLGEIDFSNDQRATVFVVNGYIRYEFRFNPSAFVASLEATFRVRA
jgi:hypothetical protein